MGNSAQGGMGGGTMMPSQSPMQAPQTQAPQAGFGPQQQAYMQYLSQAIPSINNGITAGTIQPGQQLQNFQGPQAFGLPGTGGFGGMMPGGSMAPGGGGMK